jgi:predicted Zn-dependent protease
MAENQAENPILQQSDIDKHLNEIAVMVAQQQSLQFNSQAEAQNHIKNTAAKLQQMLQQSSAMFVEGLKYLAERNQQPVSDIATQILEKLPTPGEVASILETHIVKNDHSLEQFSEAVNSFYGCGDFHVEECVISVLLTLFPLEPQPFACYGTMIWRRDGIQEAENFYKNIVDLFESPILDYFAADCYFKAGHKAEAKSLLDRALVNAHKDPEIYADIAQFVRILLREF